MRKISCTLPLRAAARRIRTAKSPGIRWYTTTLARAAAKPAKPRKFRAFGLEKPRAVYPRPASPVTPGADDAASSGTEATSASHPSSYSQTPEEIEEKRLKMRRWVMAGVFTFIIVTMTMYGAMLKTADDVKEEQEKLYTASEEETIAMLMQQRRKHERQYAELEKKLKRLRKRMSEKAEKDAAERAAAREAGAGNEAANTTAQELARNSETGNQIGVKPSSDIEEPSGREAKKGRPWWRLA